MMTGIEVVHVPYRGTPAAHSALLVGDVHAVFDAIGSSMPQIEAGPLPRRSKNGERATTRARPDIPPISDVVPGFAVIRWRGRRSSEGHPNRDSVSRLDREVNAALADPAGEVRMADLGSEPLSGSVADFTELVVEETGEVGEGCQIRLASRRSETDLIAGERPKGSQRSAVCLRCRIAGCEHWRNDA